MLYICKGTSKLNDRFMRHVLLELIPIHATAPYAIERKSPKICNEIIQTIAMHILVHVVKYAICSY